MRAVVAALAVAVLPGLARAHPDIGEMGGFIRGMQHPFGGADHVLAMLAVGLWAAQSGWRAAWPLPAAFMAMIAAGGMLGAAGVAVPFAEQGVVASVLVLGLLIAGCVRLSHGTAACLTGLFAAYHGISHGAEMPAGASGLAYGAGFLVATAFLLAAGALLARLAQHAGREVPVRLAGAVIAAAGAHLWMASGA